MQQYINEIADASGVIGESDPNAKTYSSNNYIADGDNRKEAIGKLDAQVKINTDTNDDQDITLTDHETRITNNTREIQSLTLDDLGQITLSTTNYVQFIKVIGNAAAVSLDTLAFTDTIAPQDCSVIHVIGQDDTSTVTFTYDDNDYGLLINGNATLGRGSVLTLIYDGTLLRYIEQSRNF